MNIKKQSKSDIKKSLLKELGLEKLSKEKQEDLIGKMGEIILKKMFLEIADSLSKDEQDDFEKLLNEKGTPEEIEEFLKTKIPNYEESLDKIITDLNESLKKEE